MTNVVYLLDTKTQVGYALGIYQTSQEALNLKDNLRTRFPENIFYHRVNDIYPEVIYSLADALEIVNEK